MVAAVQQPSAECTPIFTVCTRNFELDEPRFEDEIYLPKLKFVLKAHGMDMSKPAPSR